MRKVFGVLLILIGLSTGGCGLFFTGVALTDVNDPYSAAALTISIPSLLIGGLLLWPGIFLVRRPRSVSPRTTDEPPE